MAVGDGGEYSRQGVDCFVASDLLSETSAIPGAIFAAIAGVLQWCSCTEEGDEQEMDIVLQVK